MRRRTHFRGIVFGGLAHVFVGLTLAYASVEITRAVSSLAGVPNPLKTGPFEPLSLGWFVTQPLVFALGVVSGFVAAHFAPAKSRKAPLVLAGLALVLASAALPKSEHPVVLAAWLLLSPLGILLGAQTYMRKVEHRAA